MNIVTGWSALRVLRALRTRAYRGDEVWLPVAELPSRVALPYLTGDTQDDFQRTSDDTSEDAHLEGSVTRGRGGTCVIGAQPFDHRYGREVYRVGDNRPPTLADADFDFDAVMASKKVDFERFYDLGLFTVDEPLELGVFDSNKRVNLKTTKSRVLSPTLPETALLRVDSSLYIASPELIVAHIAETATLVQLMQIMMELCGSYSLPPCTSVRRSQTAGDRRAAEKNRTDGQSRVAGTEQKSVHQQKAGRSRIMEHSQATMYGIPPVTSVEMIATFISRIRMRKHARSLINEALRYVREGAASPAETNLALVLGLPAVLGGYGFGMPMLNARLPVPEEERDYVGQAYYDLDLYWADSHADLEYESTSFHLDPLYGIPSSRLTSDKVEAWREAVITRGAHDRTRLRDIQTLGVQVIPVVEDDLRDTRALDRVARALLHRKATVTEIFDESLHLAAFADHDARTSRGSLWAELHPNQ